MKKLVCVFIAVALLLTAVAAMAVDPPKAKHVIRTDPKPVIGVVKSVVITEAGKLTSLVVTTPAMLGKPGVDISITVTDKTKYYVNLRAGTVKDVKVKANVRVGLIDVLVNNAGVADKVRVIVRTPRH
jgi:hypothetical protein